MEKEFISKDLELAKADAKVYFAQMGIPEYCVNTETIEMPKKGFFGKLKGDYRIRAFIKQDDLDILGIEVNNSELKRKALPSTAARTAEKSIAKAQTTAPAVAKPIDNIADITEKKSAPSKPPRTAANIPSFEEFRNAQGNTENAAVSTEIRVTVPKPRAENSRAPKRAAPVAPKPVKPVKTEKAEITAQQPKKQREHKVARYTDEKDVYDRARDYCIAVLTAFGAENVKITISEADEYPDLDLDCPMFTVTGTGFEKLFGKHGEVLDSLQYLATLASANGQGKHAPRARFRLNYGEYREKRITALHSIADNAVSKVAETKRRIFLDPMPPEERCIVHGRVNTANDKGVYSESTGEEPFRKIVVYYKSSPSDTFNPTAVYRKTGNDHANSRYGRSDRGDRNDRGDRPRFNNDRPNRTYNDKNDRPQRTFNEHTEKRAPYSARTERANEIRSNPETPSEKPNYSDYAKELEKGFSFGKIDI